MSDTAEISQDFVPVTDPAEAASLIRECLRSFAQAVLWTRHQEIRLKGNFHKKQGPHKTFDITPSPLHDAKPIVQALLDKNPRDMYFSVSLSKAHVLFKTHFMGLKDGLLRFENPRKIYKVQRRKNVRLVIREGYLLKATFAHPVLGTIERKVHDISAGGISVIVDPKDEACFPVGLKISGMRFTIFMEPIVVDAEVRHCGTLRGKNVCKVGFRFSRIRETDASWIAKYVFEENMRFLSRLL